MRGDSLIKLLLDRLHRSGRPVVVNVKTIKVKEVKHPPVKVPVKTGK